MNTSLLLDLIRVNVINLKNAPEVRTFKNHVNGIDSLALAKMLYKIKHISDLKLTEDELQEAVRLVLIDEYIKKLKAENNQKVLEGYLKHLEKHSKSDYDKICWLYHFDFANIWQVTQVTRIEN